MLGGQVGGGGAAERVVAAQRGGGVGAVRGGGRRRGFGGLLGELQIRRVQHGEQLAGAHGVADLDGAPDDLAGDAEGELGLRAGLHGAGIG